MTDPPSTQSPLNIDDLAAGTESDQIKFGDWEVGTEIYRSEQSVVYAARPAGAPEHWPLDYALKTVVEDSSCHSLMQEAIVLAQVQNEHLITVLDAQFDAPPYYLIFPLLGGQTAADLLTNRGPLDPPHALWIVRQAAMALEELHVAGWGHGDVKPDNVMVGRTGHVTLLDLGFSRALVKRDSKKTTSEDRGLIGSLAYMAPETLLSQGRYEAVSDVYSLGVMLFELVTGRLPFEHSAAADLIAAHATQIPQDARHYRPGTPPGLADLISKMLVKQPLRRPSASELIQALSRLEIETFNLRVA
jgi:serine/threonine protein kinase